ncbi:transposase, partial [Cryobacterium sp. M15]|jgi:IS30 family transposase|uniref:transposase n=1 Tax=Cryobacterium sp. M15 TaxID=2048291 RepID=UPI003518F264
LITFHSGWWPYFQLAILALFSVGVNNPHSPWQRGTNENTNGLLRQYFPKGTDLNAHSAQRLLEVATEPNERPRKTLNRSTPADLLSRLTSKKEITPVASTI